MGTDGPGEILDANIKAMTEGQFTFDAIIVCCGTEKQANLWQDRLDRGKGTICGKGSLVVVVHEEWAKGGAGNGLGTLNAYEAACAKDKSQTLKDYLSQNKSIAMYHTAGKGTRLAPLPAGESNNKPGVKLSSTFQLPAKEGKDESVCLTILEACTPACAPRPPSLWRWPSACCCCSVL